MKEKYPYRANAVAIWCVVYAISHRGNSPTVREIGDHFKISTSAVMSCFEYLYKNGIVERVDGKLIVVGSDYAPPAWYIKQLDPPRSSEDHTAKSRRNRHPAADPI